MFVPPIVVLAFLASTLALANTDTEPELSVEDRLYDLEAQIATLKRDQEALKEKALQEQPGSFNPRISVVGDIRGQYGFHLQKDEHAKKKDHSHGEFRNGVVVKELEFEFSADVDPIADALVAVAIVPSLSHVDIHVEEAYLRLKQWPGLGFSPLGMIIKAGIFKTAIGRINRVHRHNLPQLDYPLAMQTFLGEEGYSAPGISLNFSFNPFEKSALNIFVEGVFNSRLPIQAKAARSVPSGIGHLWWHQELADEHFLDVGGSFVVGRKAERNSGAMWLLAGDVHYSYLPKGYGQDPYFLFGNEFYTANMTDRGRWPLGNYTWAQIRLFDGSFFGLSYDLAPHDDDLSQFRHSLGGYLSHYTTEFLRFRLGYEHMMPSLNSFSGDHRFMLSMIFVLGSHPVEPYFINR